MTLLFDLRELSLGSRHSLSLRIPDSSRQIRFAALCGTAHWPLALVISGVHGDEFEGPAAIAELMLELDPEQISGSVLFVPVANPESFHAGTRRHPDGGDLNRLFPGDSEGTPSEKLAHLLFHELVAPSSCVLSMHGWSKEAEVLPYVEYSSEDAGSARAAACSLGLPYVEPYDWPQGVLGKALQAYGVPVVETEIGGLGTITAAGQALSKRVILRFLQHFCLLTRESAPIAAPVSIEHMDITAPACGLFRRDVVLGAQVRAGQELGTIACLNGAICQPVAATAYGVVGIVRHFASVRTGDLLFRIFSERKSA